MEGLEKFREVPNKKVKANYKLICECHVLKKGIFLFRKIPAPYKSFIP